MQPRSCRCNVTISVVVLVQYDNHNCCCFCIWLPLALMPAKTCSFASPAGTPCTITQSYPPPICFVSHSPAYILSQKSCHLFNHTSKSFLLGSYHMKISLLSLLLLLLRVMAILSALFAYFRWSIAPGKSIIES